MRPRQVSNCIRTNTSTYQCAAKGTSVKLVTLGIDICRSAAACGPVYDPGPPNLQLSEDTEAGNTRLAPLGHSHKQGA